MHTNRWTPTLFPSASNSCSPSPWSLIFLCRKRLLKAYLSLGGLWSKSWQENALTPPENLLLTLLSFGSLKKLFCFHMASKEDMEKMEGKRKDIGQADLFRDASRTYCTHPWGCPPWQLRICHLELEIQKHCRKQNRGNKEYITSLITAVSYLKLKHVWNCIYIFSLHGIQTILRMW